MRWHTPTLCKLKCRVALMQSCLESYSWRGQVCAPSDRAERALFRICTNPAHSLFPRLTQPCKLWFHQSSNERRLQAAVVGGPITLSLQLGNVDVLQAVQPVRHPSTQLF